MARTTKLGATSRSPYTTTPSSADPFSYLTGFGNRHASEALPGTLPTACNTPQRVKYDLYSEQLNGSAFATTRANIQQAWFYRVRPSVAHRRLKRVEGKSLIESNFSLSNPRVQYLPSQLAWDPFPLPHSVESVDFVQGLKTVGGQGDPTLNEGVCIHMYAANASMGNKAFCSTDGDFLILPQQGRLHIQTEHGHLMVRPGELVVVQKGMRFKVSLPDGPARGYVQEVFGSHYELPELGPLGSNGMALPRDFETPVASFDIDESTWEIFYKMTGRLFVCEQGHTPFDVVAWHGNYAPYKYAIEKFINVGNLDRDQMDPTVYCVLTARSKVPDVSISDLLVFTAKWTVTKDTFRPPYYHRNMSTEVMGIVYGEYGGSSHVLAPGGLSYEASFMPHGETYETWKSATEADLKPQRVNVDTMAFMFHISTRFSITDFALYHSGCLHESPADQWDDLRGHFMDHLEEVEADLKKAGLPSLTHHQFNKC